MKCVFGASSHEREDVKPSARYYPSGERNDHESYYCFYCTDRPLDAIGFMMRWKGLHFYEALRSLEHTYSITYEDIEVSKDVGEDLKALTAKAARVDPWPVFEYCEKYLRENKVNIGLPRFIALSLALDKIYYKADKDKPEETVARLEKWKVVASRVASASVSRYLTSSGMEAEP